MKKLVLPLIFLFCWTINSNAQQIFTIQNGSKTVFYNTLKETLDNSVSGDTIYLPGALIIHNEDIIIDKKLALIGVGWDNESMEGLKPTILKKDNGEYVSILLKNGADGTFITGCHLGEFSLVGDMIENITLVRNFIHGGVSLGSLYTNSNKRIFIIENRMEGMININGYNASDCIIRNNFIPNALIWNIKSTQIENNIASSLSILDSCNIKNNYFTTQRSFPLDAMINFCVFDNNAFSENFTIPNHGNFGKSNNNSGENNLTNQKAEETFVGGYKLILPKDYEVLPNSPLKNAGTDGTDIGIYGGDNPYKKGAIPLNPHIEKFIVSDITDTSGELKVNIKVSAQTR